jgi:hypothetical protein
MSSIQHIAELFIFDERDFITAAYRTLLGREPDPAGMNYYLGRLRMGYGKAAIIVQLANSAEAYPHTKINGLVNLIREEQRANHWFWGIFTRQQRSERLMHQHIEELKRLNNRMVQISENTPMPRYSDNNDSNLPTTFSVEPEILNKLTPHARDIYFELKAAIIRSTGGNQ